MKQPVAIIIGAGPAGSTAAYELLKLTDIKAIVLERSEYMGGIARTLSYKGNRIDIGGHCFVSKSDRVINLMVTVPAAPDLGLGDCGSPRLVGASLEESEIQDSWNCNRHTFASRLVMASVDLRTAGGCLAIGLLAWRGGTLISPRVISSVR